MKFIISAFLIVVAAIIALVILFAPKSYKDALSEATNEARSIYQFNCSMCHGPLGQGNGPTARALPVPLPDWTVPGWQNAVTDEGIRTAIVGGGRAVGRSDYMPEHAHLDKTEELEALVLLIRDFGEK